MQRYFVYLFTLGFIHINNKLAKLKIMKFLKITRKLKLNHTNYLK